MALVFIIDRGRGVRATLPATLVCGISFALAQFVTSNFLSTQLTDIVASLVGAAAVVLLLRVWRPAQAYVEAPEEMAHAGEDRHPHVVSRHESTRDRGLPGRHSGRVGPPARPGHRHRSRARSAGRGSPRHPHGGRQGLRALPDHHRHLQRQPDPARSGTRWPRPARRSSGRVWTCRPRPASPRPCRRSSSTALGGRHADALRRPPHDPGDGISVGRAVRAYVDDLPAARRGDRHGHGRAGPGVRHERLRADGDPGHLDGRGRRGLRGALADPRLAGRGGDRLGHLVELAVRRPAGLGGQGASASARP